MPASPADPVRFADILTTANAVANYLGADVVQAAHLLDAISILCGAQSMDDLGRPLSPLVRRPPGGEGVEAGVRTLVQEWFTRLGNDAHAALAPADLAAFAAGLRSLRAPGG